jgi:uncharacterized membrane protein YedE/YeeE
LKTNLSAAIVGFLFALGLGLAGMTQTHKVIGFLDVTGNWDPSLIFVMIGSILVHAITYRLITKRSSPMFTLQWHVPKKGQITPSLIVGSIIFGMGWGLAGYCPGPAVVSASTLQHRPLLFVGSMILGMLIFKVLDKKFKFKR